jgi:hypothetical protein
MQSSRNGEIRLILIKRKLISPESQLNRQNKALDPHSAGALCTPSICPSRDLLSAVRRIRIKFKSSPSPTQPTATESLVRVSHPAAA